MNSQRSFVVATALLFAGSVVATIVWSLSMSAMGGMPMPGGWTMNMMWMPERAGRAAGFIAMWIVMMIAMMLPALAPILWRYRESVSRSGGTRAGVQTALLGAGYFVVWTIVGLLVFSLGVSVATVTMQQPALARRVPIAIGVVVAIAGALQFTSWKAHYLSCCRDAERGGSASLIKARPAFRRGLLLGFHCSCCSAGLTTILLVGGMMDLRAMAAVTAAISLERLAPTGERAARAIGAVAVFAGLALIARAVTID